MYIEVQIEFLSVYNYDLDTNMERIFNDIKYVYVYMEETEEYCTYVFIMVIKIESTLFCCLLLELLYLLD